ncbi:MAG: bifunctional (p)ppGpp synthetase/guanosine-3',5'-bis(diphosphate) 3'-pyrophosphohydrolase [Burkholderiales bacterium]|nr:bifunctional (p)ppGpp synthetase/guanosine-3',5'-bis(diphosphate) 3'-pyrophosphohydrolase [Burkholderiales bacterium]
MVTLRNTYTDIESWLELQEQNFNQSEIAQFKAAVALAQSYYQNSKFYPTQIATIDHAIACATTVANLNLYADAVIATILFDLPRFTHEWKKEVSVFGDKIIELVDGINKVSQIRKIGTLADVENQIDKSAQIEVIRKMLLAMASDIRVVLIVLVGRGELMLNLKTCQDIDMQKKIANETVKIYAPLANRLGMWQVKWELEDLSLKYLQPEQYKKIATLLEETREERLNYIEVVKSFVSKQMDESGIKDYQVSGRAKHIYSIWRKMKKKNYDFKDLYDIRAIRIIVPEIKDCYTVLGIVHTQYSPIPGEFVDYISNPKANNYQSLHTCVIGHENRVIEIQIRTFAMHDHAEYGVAAHWRYKEVDENGVDQNPEFTEKLAWLRQLLDWRDDLIDKENAAEVFKNEVFNDTIYVMTPNGRVISLPKGSTPIDFAYQLHSNLGHRCRGAKVNGQIVPLNTELENGQKVEVLTVKHGGPSIHWLHEGLVKSSKAISHIRRFIRNQNSEEFYALGKEILDKECAKFATNIRPEVKIIVAKLNLVNEKNLCINLGRGDFSAVELRETIQKIIEQKKASKAEGKDEIILQEIAALEQQAQSKKTPKKIAGVLVDGVSGILTHIAKCCKPLPGDKIIGFITQGNGVAIHRTNCQELSRQAQKFPNKVVTIAWGSGVENMHFNVDIEVVANDRSGLLRDLTVFFASEKLSINGLRSAVKNNKASMLFSIQLNNGVFDFKWLENKVLAIDGVLEVVRK